MTVAVVVIACVFLSLGMLALVAFLLRHRVRRWLSRELVGLVGPSIVAALPPRVVLANLLEKIYGPGGDYESVLVAVLGGAGHDPRGRDLAASRRTTAHFQVRTIDDATCSVVATWTHRLSGLIEDHNFVVFATCDSETWEITSRQRLVPLYESWFVPDEDLFEEIIPNLSSSLQVGINYTDESGASHQVGLQRINSTEVAVRDYSKYVRLPDETDLKNLRILQFDLGELFGDDHVVNAIRGLSVRFEAKEPFGDGFLTWSPPYPCFVERLTFDVTELASAGHDLVFKIVVFTMKAIAPGAQWASAADIRAVELDSWLLPGHGVALLWKPVDQVDPHGGQRR